MEVNGEATVEIEKMKAEPVRIVSDPLSVDSTPEKGGKEKDEDSVIVMEELSPQRRMSLRSRSTPKKYLDEEDELKETVDKDPLEVTPVKSPVQRATVTISKSPVKMLKPMKVIRPPPELIKAPKLPISSSTSVTVVPRKLSSDVDLVLKPRPVSSPSVTVSTVPPPKPVPKPVQPPPVRKSSANGSVKADPFDTLGLSDDSFIVEAPSFVVPYLIEKAAGEELKKLVELVKPPAKREPKEDSSDEESDSDSKEDKPEKQEKPDFKKEDDDYFQGPIGRFFLDIGLSLVQEHVQGDLLRVQKRKVSRGTKISDPSLSVNALSKGLEVTKAKNDPYRLPVITCDRCNFKTESKLVMANHWSTPLSLGSGPSLRYACHWCGHESKDLLGVSAHIETEHALKSTHLPELAPHQCPLCPFEDAAKSKVTRHAISCQKRFLPERNLEPPLDWEPPAKIPRTRGPRSYQGPTMPSIAKGIQLPYHPLLPASAHSSLYNNAQASMPAKPKPPPQMPAAFANSLLPKAFAGLNASLLQQSKANYRQNAGSFSPFSVPNNQVYQALAKSFPFLQGQVAASSIAGSKSAPADKLKKTSISMLPGVVNTSGLTIQSSTSSSKARTSGGQQQQQQQQQPSISITPLPRAAPVAPSAAVPSNKVSSSLPGAATVTKSLPAAPKPVQSGSAPGKGVVCEICDNSIKDLEQLRHHMQWIHKVKIHPKMIHNRPPLNCQKCQCRFFTDQGLERHLLGSHGLVTSSMQEAANRGQDGGRCPICGKIHQWKLLSHVVKDHGLSLKPAHLSYKCTVCTATFTMYKLFENHVYTAHSVVARKVLDKSENKKGSSSSSASSSGGVLRINDEITIIPQTTPASSARPGDKRSRVDVIDVSDDEDQLALPKSQVTITKVPAPSAKKRPRQDNPLE